MLTSDTEDEVVKNGSTTMKNVTDFNSDQTTI